MCTHLVALDALAAAGAVEAGRLEGEPVLAARLAHAVVRKLEHGLGLAAASARHLQLVTCHIQVLGRL